MKEKVKKEFLKIFYVASFLFITIFFILPYLIQLSTFFHEKSHQKILTKYGVSNTYNINLIETIPNFFNPTMDKLGITKFDFDTYNRLDKSSKADIHIAGVISDLTFLFLISTYLAIVNIYCYYMIKFKKTYNFTWILAINWILFMWLLALVQITVANLSYPSGDFYSLIRNI